MFFIFRFKAMFELRVFCCIMSQCLRTPDSVGGDILHVPSPKSHFLEFTVFLLLFFAILPPRIRSLLCICNRQIIYNQHVLHFIVHCSCHIIGITPLMSWFTNHVTHIVGLFCTFFSLLSPHKLCWIFVSAYQFEADHPFLNHA